MTCAASVCTVLSSPSRKVTAITLHRWACALPSSSREPTHAYCVPNSLRSCLLVHPETPLSAPLLIVSRLKLTVAARRKNSSPENLTHLHYNLLGKDSSVLGQKSYNMPGFGFSTPASKEARNSLHQRGRSSTGRIAEWPAPLFPH